MAGTWACKTVGGVTTSCATGQVRTASFTPTSSFTASTNHYIELNPEHQLGVTDLAGNPFDRYTMYFFTGI